MINTFMVKIIHIYKQKKYIFGTFSNIMDQLACKTKATLPCRLGLKNIPIAFLQRYKTSPTTVPDMTLNNLMVRFR